MARLLTSLRPAECRRREDLAAYVNSSPELAFDFSAFESPIGDRNPDPPQPRFFADEQLAPTMSIKSATTPTPLATSSSKYGLDYFLKGVRTISAVSTATVHDLRFVVVPLDPLAPPPPVVLIAHLFHCPPRPSPEASAVACKWACAQDSTNCRDNNANARTPPHAAPTALCARWTW